jgi:hydroxyacylglutathione hydrolase
VANAAFAETVEPSNIFLRMRSTEARQQRLAGHATVPSSLGDERHGNPFLRVDKPEVRASVERHAGRALADRVEVFAELRRWKDGFRA